MSFEKEVVLEDIISDLREAIRKNANDFSHLSYGKDEGSVTTRKMAENVAHRDGLIEAITIVRGYL